MVSYDSYFDPPAEVWGACPACGVTQEDAEPIAGGDSWLCPCGREYTEDEAHPDPSDDEPHDFDEWREERGL